MDYPKEIIIPDKLKQSNTISIAPPTTDFVYYDFKELCSTQIVLAGIDYKEYIEDQYISMLEDITTYDLNKRIKKSTQSVNVHEDFANKKEIIPSKTLSMNIPQLVPINATDTLINLNLQNLSLGGKTKTKAELKQSDLSPIVEKEEDELNLGAIEHKKNNLINRARRLTLKRASNVNIRINKSENAEIKFPPIAEKPPQANRKKHMIIQNMQNLDLNGHSNPTHSNKFLDPIHFTQIDSFKTASPFNVKRSSTYSKAQKIQFNSNTRELLSSTAASNRITPNITFQNALKKQPNDSAIHNDTESIRELLSDMNVSTSNKCNKKLKLDSLFLPKVTKSELKNYKPPNKTKYKKDPYSVDWNFKILKNYYSVSCEDKGTTVVGLPQFKIKKLIRSSRKKNA